MVVNSIIINFRILQIRLGLYSIPFHWKKSFKEGFKKTILQKKIFFFHNDLWHCFEVHSELSNPNKEHFLQRLNQLVDATQQHICTATHCIITYGTSWVYRNIESNTIVANCHKVPQKQFTKELLSVETLEKSIQNTIALIQKVNPKAHFIFTVSPVRHIKDGFVENQISKAHLITAIHSIDKAQLLTPNYFPSYEIMMDELRDYRFYAEDMLHPNSTAIAYIWQRFKETTINETAIATMDKVDSIQKSLAHKPFNPHSDSHQKFEANRSKKIADLISEYPFMRF